ncbi:uncharacterized protein Tco025E_04834 [Trypanosoma conorhini]|uniref:DUF676 domain-containing protein n=1 Tax=Trypanosoma conorhini TaxID=83891 RepID=A0A422PI88_9TRYP|nr:uncharacterized protein Tco025E_04834 [Trypanosoma conorhini]RNF17442.1 hypothetical protein Tco025E_04834 [Trypanosoma conorhini]
MKHRVVVLQHGSHGTRSDLGCLARLLRALDPPPVVVQPHVNEGFRTDDGVVVCGARLAEVVLGVLNGLCPEAARATPATSRGDGETTVQLSFVAHSMGGLIVREALPQLARELRQREGNLRVVWKLFCSIATPHAGTCHMDAFVRSYLGRLLGRLYSTAYHDMFLQSSVLTERLISAEHLASLAAFEKRLLLSSLTDLVVPLMSSGFMLKPSQRAGMSSAARAEQEAAMCAASEEEMRAKRRTLTELRAEEWPQDQYPVERRIAEAMLKGAGAFDSIVVDFTNLHTHCDSPHVRRTAEQLSHRALVCKEPIQSMGLEDVFSFVSRHVVSELAAGHR